MGKLVATMINYRVLVIFLDNFADGSLGSIRRITGGLLLLLLLKKILKSGVTIVSRDSKDLLISLEIALEIFRTTPIGICSDSAIEEIISESFLAMQQISQGKEMI